MGTIAPDSPTSGTNATMMNDIMRMMSEVAELSRKGMRQRAIESSKLQVGDITAICSHDEAVCDVTSGDEVCTRCGMILYPILVESRTLDELPDMERMRIDSIFRDLCDANMLNEGVARRASDEFFRFKRICCEEDDSKKVYAGNKMRFNEKKFIAYSLYFATFAEGSPRPPMEIAMYTNVTKSILCDMEHIFPIPIDSIKPEAFLPRYCYHLNLNRRDVLDMEEMCDKLRFVDAHDPRTVAASVIRYHCLKHGIHKTLKEIGEVCNITPSSISKCFNLICKELDPVK